MKEIILLEQVYGYELALKNNAISYSHVEGPDPDRHDVLPLLQAIHEKRDKAMEYLHGRSKPVDVAEHIWDSAEKAQVSAMQAEHLGDFELAEKEWQRSVRLFAAAAKAFGILEPHIPWDEWVAGYAAKRGNSSGDGRKV